MDALKQTAVTALLNLPEFADIDDMIAALRNLKCHRELATPPTSPPSFLEVAREYIGSLEGPPRLVSESNHGLKRNLVWNWTTVASDSPKKWLEHV